MTGSALPDPLAIRRASRRAGAAGVCLSGLLLMLPALTGCFATSKQVELIETDLNRRGAWSDERIETLQREVTAVRSENEALRLRLDDLSDQLVALGEEVAGRIQDLQEADRRVEDVARQGAAEAERVDATQAQDREDLLQRMNLLLDEVVKENQKLVERIDAVESSAFTFGKMHEVERGESLASIAKKYGVTADAIADANGLSDANLIRVGQQLLIPGLNR
ncbi:LysM peptidoglycan-binding domain-containing protein [bacterium]|nr:LysM peptidoglycan-binding domain-containing protein [bacterium]